MVPSVRSKSLVIEIWMVLILMMILMMIMMMILMMIMMTKPYDYDDDTDDDNDHKNDSYTAAGVAPGASVPCSSFQLLASSPVWLLASGFRLSLVWLPVWFRLPCPEPEAGSGPRARSWHQVRLKISFIVSSDC